LGTTRSTFRRGLFVAREGVSLVGGGQRRVKALRATRFFWGTTRRSSLPWRAGVCPPYVLVGEAGDLGEFFGDFAVAAAAGHLVLSAPFFLGAEPVFEDAGHDEFDDRGIEAAAVAFGFVVVVEALELDVEFGGEDGAGGGLGGVGIELHPPFVASAALADGGVGEEGGDVSWRAVRPT